MRKRMSAAAVSAVALAAVASPAVGATQGAYTNYIGNAMPCGTRHIVIEAPPHAWGIRDAANLMDAQLPSVRIHVRPGLDATYRPHALHVVVDMGDYGLDGGYAEASGRHSLTPTNRQLYFRDGYWRSDGDRHMWLNTALDRMPYFNLPGVQYNMASVHEWYAAHEFGHLLGLIHHDQPGIMQNRTMDDHDLGPVEVAAIEDSLRRCTDG